MTFPLKVLTPSHILATKYQQVLGQRRRGSPHQKRAKTSLALAQSYMDSMPASSQFFLMNNEITIFDERIPKKNQQNILAKHYTRPQFVAEV